jgi:tripartite-type tricarboxylate transporter receptor subunit TctC
VVPFAPGGANDVVIRIVGDVAQKKLGQPFIVDNRPGAAGNIAAANVERSTPDGYSMLMGNLGLIVHNPLLYPKPGFDAASLVPVACMALTTMVVKVPAASPFKSFQDLVAYAKANPGKLSYASVGNGSVIHLGTELLLSSLGLSALQIPYTGGGPMANAVMAGDVDFVADPLVYGGDRIRALAVLDSRRKATYPDAPAITELGYPLVDASSWIGLFAPRGTPSQAVEALGREMTAALKSPDVREKLQKAGMEPCDDAGPAAFAERIKASQALWTPLIRKLNIKIE